MTCMCYALSNVYSNKITPETQYNFWRTWSSHCHHPGFPYNEINYHKIKGYSVRRKQVPMCATFSMTDYKIQGSTLKSAVLNWPQRRPNCQRSRWAINIWQDRQEGRGGVAPSSPTGSRLCRIGSFRANAQELGVDIIRNFARDMYSYRGLKLKPDWFSLLQEVDMNDLRFHQHDLLAAKMERLRTEYKPSLSNNKIRFSITVFK